GGGPQRGPFYTRRGRGRARGGRPLTRPPFPFSGAPPTFQRGRLTADIDPKRTCELIEWCNHQALGSLASGKNSCWPQTLLRAWRARLRAVFPVAGLRSVRANPSRIAAGERACQPGAEPSLAASQLGSACYHVPACPPEHPSCLPLIA